MAVVKVRGELHCYNCGYVAAKVEGDQSDTDLTARLITPAAGPGVRLRRGAAPRCGRCGGRLFLDEVEVVRQPLPEEGPIIPLGSLFYSNVRVER